MLKISILLSCFPISGSAFYLPGIAPLEYLQGDNVELTVNKLTSVKTQLPYSYYTLPFCKPAAHTSKVDNLGEILTGDVVENTPYNVTMNENKKCQFLCTKELNEVDKALFKAMIDDEYYVNMLIDNLPAATRYHTVHDSQVYLYTNGFPIGIVNGNNYFLYNHIKITVKYHQDADEYDGFRVVGFEISPSSMKQQIDAQKRATCPALATASQDFFNLDEQKEVIFTYDVQWEYSDVKWASRWDNFLRMSDGKIHWFSIVNSLMIVLFLSGVVALIIVRTLHKDIVKYNEVAVSDDVEESGWKLVHGDVFRKPRFAKLLSMSVGAGVQILGMTFGSLFFATAGFLSPAYRGGFLQALLLLFVFMGVFAGYVSARLYKMFKGEDWKTATLMTAFLYPGVVFSIFFILNLFIWAEKSSGAVPFTTMLAMLIMWFGISVPLVFVGAYFGFKKGPISLPVRTNQIPRQVPKQPWFMSTGFTCMVGGILPFGAVFTELFFIMSSIWQHQFYYLFGFLVLVMLILIMTCAEISIAFTYFQLASEDYNWWWRSFLCSASSGIYIFAYSVLYFAMRLRITRFSSTCLYFGYMFIASYTFFLLTGAVGLMATFLFVRVIYGSIKID